MFELIDQAFTGVQPLLLANSRRGKPMTGPMPGPGRHPAEVAHRPAMAVDLALQRRADNHRMLLRSAGRLYLILSPTAPEHADAWFQHLQEGRWTPAMGFVTAARG